MNTCRALGCTQCFNICPCSCISILTLNTFLTVLPIEMHLHVFTDNDIENNIWDQLVILALPSRILSMFLSTNTYNELLVYYSFVFLYWTCQDSPNA